MTQTLQGQHAGFSGLYSQLQQSSKAGHVWALNKLAEAPAGTVERIDALLQAQGINRLADDTLGGNMSIAVEIPGENAVLRIADASVEPPRPRHPGVLQPLAPPQSVDNFRIEVLPKVMGLQEALDNQLISGADARRQVGGLMNGFEQSGLLFWDCKMADLGVVADATGAPRLVVIDGGAVCPEAEKFGGKIGNDTQTNYDKYLVNVDHLFTQLSQEPQSQARSETPPASSQENTAQPGLWQRIKFTAFNIKESLFGSEKSPPAPGSILVMTPPRPEMEYPAFSPPEKNWAQTEMQRRAVMTERQNTR